MKKKILCDVGIIIGEFWYVVGNKSKGVLRI